MSGSLRDLGEFSFIQRITQSLPARTDVIERIGDDCAVVRAGASTLLVSCDASVEDVHFSFATASAHDIGWKAATSAISDIGAMAGVPLFLTVTLAMPSDTDTRRAEELFGGIAAAAAAHHAGIIGGDTTGSPGPFFVDITVIGSAGERTLLRRDAQAGDLLAVTGHPGCSAAGLAALQRGMPAPELTRAHLHPKARIREAQWLAQRPQVHAMIDVSDGLAQDAGHIGEASGLGVGIDRHLLPLSSLLLEFSESAGLDASAFALGGGEDYELALALAPEGSAEVCRAFSASFGLPLTVVGRFDSEWRGVRVDGQSCVPGFQHFA